MEWYYLVALFAIGTVVYLVVGWIGNKAVDKTENALRARRVQKQNERSAPAQPARRLADQMTPQAAGQARQTTVFPGPQAAAAAPAAQQAAPLPQERKARFCAACGVSLAENAKFCPMCGAVVENYRSKE